MQVTYELTAEDYRHALITYRNSNFFTKWAALFLLAVAALIAVMEIVLLIISPQQWSWQAFALTAGYAAAWGFFYWKGPSINANRQFRNTPSAKGPVTLEVSETRLHYRSVVTDGIVSWNSYIKWMQDEVVFVLFPAPKVFVVIPKRAFSSDQSKTFSEMLQQNIKNQK